MSAWAEFDQQPRFSFAKGPAKFEVGLLGVLKDGHRVDDSVGRQADADTFAADGLADRIDHFQGEAQAALHRLRGVPVCPVIDERIHELVKEVSQPIPG